MIEKTKSIYGQVIIQERYIKTNSKVYRQWRFEWEDEWKTEETAYDNLPWIKVNFLKDKKFFKV